MLPSKAVTSSSYLSTPPLLDPIAASFTFHWPNIPHAETQILQPSARAVYQAASIVFSLLHRIFPAGNPTPLSAKEAYNHLHLWRAMKGSFFLRVSKDCRQ